MTFTGFHSVFPSFLSLGTVFLCRKISLNFGITFLVYLPIKAISTHKILKLSITVLRGKNTKTWENQNLNDLILETLAWSNFCHRKLIPNNKDLALFKRKKKSCFLENSCIGNLLQWSSLWICNKIWGFGKKLTFGIQNHW